MPSGNSTQLWKRPATSCETRLEPAPTLDSNKVNRQQEQSCRAVKSKIDTGSEACAGENDLLKEQGRVGSQLQKVVVNPPSGYRAANPQADRKSYYVNGIVLERQALIDQLREIAKVRGTPITAIINNQDDPTLGEGTPSFVQSVFNGAAGIVSSKMGAAAEAAAVDSIKKEMISQILTKSGRMHIDAHSQGSVIVSNALRVLENEVTPQQWKQIQERLSVSTFGAAMHLFPCGVKVNEYAFSGDLLASSTEVASSGRQKLAKVMKDVLGGIHPKVDQALPAVMQPTKACTLDNISLQSHDALLYLKNIPKFFIESYRKTGGDIQIDQLTSGLVRAIKNGRFSDQAVQHILGLLDNEGCGQKVRLDLCKAQNEGKLGKFNLFKA